MVSALGINIQLVFAGAFFIGAMLAGYGGVLGGTMISLQPGEDTSFLLNSLIVVIIGGMGSLGGAAIGAIALGLVDAYADVYLIFGDTDLTNYSILRHVRAAGQRCSPCGRSACSGGRHEPRRRRPGAETDADGTRHALADGLDRLAAVVASRSRRCVFTDFFLSQILTKALWLGLAAASLIFLSAYGGMVSLGQVGDLRHRRHDLRQPRRGRRRQPRRVVAVAGRDRGDRGRDARRPAVRLHRRRAARASTS